jgi:hypothetical protein
MRDLLGGIVTAGPFGAHLIGNIRARGLIDHAHR